METLLSLSFSNISSRDAGKIRKGLRQIEGLLAQICLSTSGNVDRRASVIEVQRPKPSKKLGDLRYDPAFLEFFRLQDGFEWNVTTHLVTCLERLLSMPPNSANDLLLLNALTLLQGMLLLHPPSRALFGREIYMNLLLDLLPPSLPPAIQSTTLLVLVTALLDTPLNARVFERVDGLLAVTALFKERETSRSVKLKVLEFLYFYLMDEDTECGRGSSKRSTRNDGAAEDGEDGADTDADDSSVSTTGTMRRVGSGPGVVNKTGSAGSNSSFVSGWVGADMSSLADLEDGGLIRTTREKQKLLGKYLSNVDDLVQDLKESRVFESTVA